jgi:2-dehydro-3-deoxyphosphooctonate aldolase (KDO 8-P synthase)
MKLLNFEIGPDKPFFLIAGPCVIESEELQMHTAEKLKRMTERLGINFIFKSSFDKANRTSVDGYRGLGMDEGLRILRKVRDELEIPVLTDVHEYTPLEEVAESVDMLQTPAFLCRQTDYIQKVAALGLPVNIKKGQFLAPNDMYNVIQKAKGTASNTILACERGVSFGYNNLVVDMTSLKTMSAFAPVVFDATHSVQMPGGLGNASGGRAEMIPVLARAAVGAGVSGLFMETHPNPDEALCDGPNNVRLSHLECMLMQLQEIDRIVK